MGKKIGVSALLAGLIGVSIYMWSENAGEEVDNSISQRTQKWQCGQCDGEFELTVAESTEMFKASKQGVICPLCQATGAEKQDVQAFVGRRGFGSDAASDDEEEEEEEQEAEDVHSFGGRQKRPTD